MIEKKLTKGIEKKTSVPDNAIEIFLKSKEQEKTPIYSTEPSSDYQHKIDFSREGTHYWVS